MFACGRHRTASHLSVHRLRPAVSNEPKLGLSHAKSTTRASEVISSPLFTSIHLFTIVTNRVSVTQFCKSGTFFMFVRSFVLLSLVELSTAFTAVMHPQFRVVLALFGANRKASLFVSETYITSYASVHVCLRKELVVFTYPGR